MKVTTLKDGSVINLDQITKVTPIEKIDPNHHIVMSGEKNVMFQFIIYQGDTRTIMSSEEFLPGTKEEIHEEAIKELREERDRIIAQL